MTLADTLSFMKKENYAILSFAIGFIIGLIPGLGLIGTLAGGFLYAYFSIFYGEIPKDQVEAAKRGAIMGLVLAVVDFLITWPFRLFWFPAFTIAGAAFILGLIYVAIIGAIAGGLGGFLAFYVE